MKKNEMTTEDYKVVCEFLYAILDDIDTASDVARGSDAIYRNLVERLQSSKEEVGGSPDGHTVVFNPPRKPYGFSRIFGGVK